MTKTNKMINELLNTAEAEFSEGKPVQVVIAYLDGQKIILDCVCTEEFMKFLKEIFKGINNRPFECV